MHIPRSSSVDHGYAWVALASTSVMRLLLSGFKGSIGIIFVYWEESFGVSPADTALAGSILVFLSLGMAPISSALFKKLAHRIGVVCAGTVVAVCFLAAPFVDVFWHIYIIFAILGIAMGLCYQPAYSFFAFFFDKYSASAHTLAGAASGIGLLGFPPLMEYLMSCYGWRGAFHITAAIMGHLCVCGLLLYKPETEKYNNISTPPKSSLVSNALPKTTVNDNIFVSFVKDIGREFDLSLFKNVRFLFQTVVNGFLLGGYDSAIVYLVPYAVSVGTSDRNSSLLMLYYGIATVLVRLTPVGLLVDHGFISAANFASLNHLLMSMVIIAISFTQSYPLLALFAVLFGAFQGIGGCMFYVVVAASPGSRQKGPAAIGWYLLLNGLGTTVMIYVVGVLSEITDSYRWPMIMCGACVFLVGIILLLDPIFVRWQHSIEKRQQENTFSPKINDHTEPANLRPIVS